jgi:hypothetical protein
MSYRIRYTQGPDSLGFGPLTLIRGAWLDVDDPALTFQAMLAQRVAEFGFECESAAPAQSASGPEATPDAKPAKTKKAGDSVQDNLAEKA